MGRRFNALRARVCVREEKRERKERKTRKEREKIEKQRLHGERDKMKEK
jgi:hypothetical protein